MYVDPELSHCSAVSSSLYLNKFLPLTLLYLLPSLLVPPIKSSCYSLYIFLLLLKIHSSEPWLRGPADPTSFVNVVG